MSEGYQSEIATAVINYQTSYLLCKDLNLSLEETHKRLDALDFTNIETFMQQAVEAFRVSDPKRQSETENQNPKLWDDKRLTVRGKDSLSVGPIHDQLLFRDLHLIFDKPNQQIKCYEPGRSMLWTEDLQAFRMIPIPEMFVGVTLHRVDGLIQSHFGGTPDAPQSWISLSEEDGLIRQQFLVNNIGEVAKEMEFHEFSTFPGGVVMPLVKVEISYTDEIMRSIQFTVVKDAQFNREIDENIFVIPYPKGGGWHDFRNNEEKGGVFQEPVSDVVEFFLSRKGALPGQKLAVKANNSLTSWIFFFNGLILIIIGVYLWKRYP